MMFIPEDYTKGLIIEPIEPTILFGGVEYSRPKKIDMGNLLLSMLLFMLGLIGSGFIGMCFGLILLCCK